MWVLGSVGVEERFQEYVRVRGSLGIYGFEGLDGFYECASNVLRGVWSVSVEVIQGTPDRAVLGGQG